MAYDDSNCVCGDRKAPGQFLCDTCVEFMGDRKELANVNNEKLSVEFRRHSAIICVSVCRGRKKQQERKVEHGHTEHRNP